MTSHILSAIPASVSRRSLLGIAVLTTLTVGAAFAATAASVGAFSPGALTAAQQGGKPILVHISAPWCPTCRAQKPIIGELTAKDKFKNFVVFDVDFDSQKDAVRSLNARSQSTIVVYKGNTEVGRSAGDTNAASIEALLAKAL